MSGTGHWDASTEGVSERSVLRALRPHLNNLQDWKIELKAAVPRVLEFRNGFDKRASAPTILW
jgi:hypothetical protein